MLLVSKKLDAKEEGMGTTRDPQWLTKLYSQSFPVDQPVDLTITVDGSADNSGMIAFIRCIPGLYEALRAPQRGDDDPLTLEDPEDLYYLLKNVHEARMNLQTQEERVMLACRDAGVSMETMASALGLKRKQNVDYHLRRIDRAAEKGRTAASLEHEADVD
jgi:hypothetical protein